MGDAGKIILEHLGRGLDAVFKDDAAYRSYLRSRDLGISREGLCGFYGEEPVQRFEARYVREWNAGARQADDTITAHNGPDYTPYGQVIKHGVDPEGQ